MTLSFNDFCSRLIRQTKNYLAGIPQYEISHRDYANREKVLLVKHIDEKRTVRAYNLNDLYKDYRNGASLEGIALEVSESIKEDGKDFKSLLAEYDNLDDYEKAKSKLVVTFATASLTGGDLKQFPHKRIGPMNLLVCASISDVISGQQYLLPITMDRFRNYKVSKEAFFDAAIRNTEFRNEHTAEETKIKYDDSVTLKCVEISYKDNDFGASCLVDSSALDLASSYLGEKGFYIMPASVKSFAAVEDPGFPLCEYLEDMLSLFNDSENEPYEKISDRCLFYDSASKSLCDAKIHDLTRYGGRKKR